MKNTLKALAIMLIICSGIAVSCSKPEAPSINPNNLGNGTDTTTGNGQDTITVTADTLSAHLLFHSFTKEQGAIPDVAPAGGVVQISVKDSIFLTDELLKPIKFLHKDPSKNISGVYVQVLLNSGASSFYYDVPEIESMQESDTVSVIMIGINPGNLKMPQTGEIKIVPYDKNKQPVTQIIRPLKITENEVDAPDGSGNGCGLSLPVGQYWNWELSVRVDDIDAFWSEPNKVHGPEGQDIQGHCCNGNSTYPLNCPGDSTGNIGLRQLHFATYYKINFELFLFFTNGKFERDTQEDSPLPFPGESDFCAGGSGIVRENINTTEYEGNWTISPSSLPPGYLWPGDSLQLTLQTTSSTGTGYGNPGGVIHQLDCNIGALVLIQLDREGSGAHLVKFYGVRNVGDPLWYD